MKPKTKCEKKWFNLGARAALTIVHRHVRTLLKKRYDSIVNGDTLSQWLLDADKRYQAKPGGIGRKAK